MIIVLQNSNQSNRILYCAVNNMLPQDWLYFNVLLKVRHFYFISLDWCTLLYSTLLYSTLLYSTLLYSTLLYSTLLFSTLLPCFAFLQSSASVLYSDSLLQLFKSRAGTYNSIRLAWPGISMYLVCTNGGGIKH